MARPLLIAAFFWVSLSVAGVISTGWALHSAWLSWRVAHESRRDGLCIVARARLRRQALRLEILLVALGIGLIVLLVDTTNPTVRLVTRWGIISILLTVVVDGMLDVAEDRKLDAIQSRPQRPPGG